MRSLLEKFGQEDAVTKKVVIDSAAATATEPRRITQVNSAVQALSWSPGGERLLLWTKAGELAVLDQKGYRLSSIEAHEQEILKADWSACGQFVATAGRDETCKIWDIASARCTAVMRHPEGSVRLLSWSPWCSLLLTGSGSKIRLWSESGRLVDELAGHSCPLTDLAWHPIERNLLASCAADGICIWNLGDERPIHRLNCKEHPVQLRFSRRGSVMAYGLADSSIHVWTMGSGIVLKLPGKDGGLNGLDWSWGGQWLAFCRDYDAFLWRFDDRSASLCKLHCSQKRLRHIRFHTYEHLLAIADEKGCVNVWRTDQEDKTAPLAACHEDCAVTGLSWNPFFRQLAIGYENGSVFLWENEFKSADLKEGLNDY